MQIQHPQNSYNGIPADDVFLALDDMGTQIGLGYIIYQYLPSRSPECPVNLYFEINSLPSGRYLLLGALAARARQLRERVPNSPARLYTRIDPNDEAARREYADSGFDCSQNETFMQIYPPQGDGRVPMSCSLIPIPLNTYQEQMSFIQRLQQNDITHLAQPMIHQLQQMPHFLALGLAQGQDLLGEILMAGTGDTCELACLYITRPYRHQGMGRQLLHRSMAVLASEGVTRFGGTFVSLSVPQMHLAHDFGGTDIQVRGVFPQLML